ncbi:uncharacterized protein EV154DRAFT_495342 [Mucor mucedo]|uniref:uncharacterized protein n=1 Tax=Mucor mucedo TaxID=29922 RepID=UPI00221F05D1|nr:uncharacterized protein EV154DRAFT_495342 [Mucor mucedo]KAI7895570.1 hypothetical protein EV154DRAFT_495342 [Mucor mucedo]
MAAFAYLPREIWDIIFLYAGDHVKKRRMMSVNRHWYTMHLSVVFKAPSISLGCKRSKYNSIMNSPFFPGQWTTSVNLSSFEAETEHNNDVTQSNLYRFMMYTPNVEEVKFDFIEKIKEKDWAYFYKVLKTANVWKLHRLQDDWDLFNVNKRIDVTAVYSIYLKCAQHLKRSLVSTRLIEKYMPTNFGVSFLHELVALSSLHITRGFLKNVNDLDIILQYSPQLEELNVDFSNTRFDSDHPSDRPILNEVYPNMKVLTFHDYVFQTDNQVCIFHNNFTGLRKLQITCAQNKLNLKPETTEDFFIMLASLSTYHIRFNKYAIVISDFINENCRQDMHAFVHDKSGEDRNAIIISKTERIPEAMVKYDYSTAIHILSRLGPHVQKIQLVCLENGYTEHLLERLFSTQCITINAIVCQGLDLHRLTEADLLYTSYIQSLTFYDCEFSEKFLKVLSAGFTQLDTVHFKSCYFKYSWINVTMPSTDIHTLCISYNLPFCVTFVDNLNELRWRNLNNGMMENPHTFPLVSITLTDEGITRYYYTRGEDKPVAVETSETQFQLLAEMVPEKDFFKIINISVRSIQKLSLKLNSNRSNDIEMIF